MALRHPYCGPGPVLAHLGDSGIDPQWTYTGTWIKFNPGATDRTCLYQSSSAGGTGTFTSANAGTIVELWYSNASAAFNVTIDGGAPVTITPAGGTTIGKYQVTGLADTTHTVLATRTGGPIYLTAATVRKASGVSVGSFGLGGARLSDTNLSQPYDLRSVTLGWAPHLVVIGFMTNEAYTSISAATYKTNLQSAITAFSGAGVDILLIAQIPAASLTLTDYRTALYELADANDIPVLDLFERWGSYTTVNALGMMFDGFHPSAIGNVEYGQAVRNVIA
jgi:lysophospholipase L1-like esterase